jgi:hypothetical protein
VSSGNREFRKQGVQETVLQETGVQETVRSGNSEFRKQCVQETGIQETVFLFQTNNPLYTQLAS